jgi:quercetin dioxygenase-like cupin family protein
MENIFIKKATAFHIVDVLEYQPQSIVIKSILRKATGQVSGLSFDTGEVLVGKISPFDTLLQIIDGNAEIIIDDKSNLLGIGQSIIVPANSSNMIKAPQRFKMLSTIIKSGYEDISL